MQRFAALERQLRARFARGERELPLLKATKGPILAPRPQEFGECRIIGGNALDWGWWTMRSVIVVAALLCASSAVVRAQQISCGDVPKIQRSVEQKLKADVEGKAQLFTKLLGNADVKGTVEKSKTELYQEHQDVGKDEIDLYFAWVSCQTIASDQSLSSTDKVNQWMAIYKVLLGRGPAGPIAKTPAKPSIDSFCVLYRWDQVRGKASCFIDERPHGDDYVHPKY